MAWAWPCGPWGAMEGCGGGDQDLSLCVVKGYLEMGRWGPLALVAKFQKAGRTGLLGESGSHAGKRVKIGGGKQGI